MYTNPNSMPDLPQPEPDDDVLIARVRRGELEAFGALLDRHLQHLRMFAALRVPGENAIDPIAEEAFVFAFNNLADFPLGSSFRGWLRAIAWNLIIEELQRRGLDASHQSRFQQQRLTDLREEIVAAADSDEADFFEECVREIPPALAALLEQRYRDGRENEEIATQSGLSAAWIRNLFFRIRQDVKHCVDTKLRSAANAQ